MTIVHRQEDIAKHTSLQHVVEKFVHLEEITIQQKDYNPYESTPTVAITETFFHTFLCSVLKAHSRRLKALHLCTSLPLDPQLYIDLRDKTPNLRSVTFTTNIRADIEDVFAEPVPWASGQMGHLESLTFLGCDGTNADSFVQNLLQGAYGIRLKEVQFIRSGRYLVQIPESPSCSVFRSVESFHFDHINSQELSSIALIPIQELSLTCITYDAFCRLPTLLEGGLSNVGGVGFRGPRKLKLSPKFASKASWERFPAECKAAYTELRERCLPQRGIQLTLDAVDRPFNCVCGNHE